MSTQVDWIKLNPFLRVTSFYCLPTCLTLTQNSMNSQTTWVLLRIFLRHRRLSLTFMTLALFREIELKTRFSLNSQVVQREKRLTGVISSSECKESEKKGEIDEMTKSGKMLIRMMMRWQKWWGTRPSTQEQEKNVSKDNDEVKWMEFCIQKMFFN